MVRGRWITGLIVVTSLVGCGGDGSSAPATSEPLGGGTAVTAEVTMPNPPETAAPTTSKAPPTIPPTTGPPAMTPTTAPVGATSTEAPRQDAAPTGMLDAWPASEIDWDVVGSGWVLMTYAWPIGDAVDDPTTEYDVTLFLLGPTGDFFDVGRLPGPYPRSHWMTDLSADGRTAALISYDEGSSPPNFWLLDLPTMQLARFPAPDSAWDVRFSRKDDSILVEERFTSAPPPNWIGSRVSRSTLDGTTADTLVDLELGPEQQPLSIPFSYLELDSGDIATIEADTMLLRHSSGNPIRQLQTPTSECSVVDQWPDGRIVISCPDPKAEPVCWTRGLWLVPIDGGAPTELATPDSSESEPSCFASYWMAEPIGEVTALERGQGEGECTQLIELTDGTSTQIWQPDDEQLCNAHLIGVRDGAWLVHARGLHGEFGNQYMGPGVLYELHTDGTSRALTPTTLQSGWNAIGVLRNVQVIGS